MSNPEAERPELKALERLDAAVGRTIEKLAALEKRVAEAEAAREELRGALERFRSGDTDPAEIARRAEAVDKQNAELRERMESSREQVETMLARIRFLEENP